MTRADLEADLYQDFGYAASPASSVTTRIRSYLNMRHRRILNRAGLEKLRFESQSFATVASDRKSTRLNSSHSRASRMPSSA